MFIKRTVILMLIAFVAVAGDASAQRGRRNAEFERPDTPTRFDSPDIGMAFDVPEGARLYTPAAPGRYRSLLGEGRFLYLDNPAMRSVSIVGKASGNVTDAELKGYRDILDSNPPQAKLEGFKKHSVRFIRIGTLGDKDALEFVYDAGPSTIRQVVFIHNGKGITVTCTSLQAQFGSAESDVFKPLFSHLEFR